MRWRAVVVAVWVVVGLFAVELGFREYLKFQIARTLVVPRETGAFDPELGWALAPNGFGISNRIGEIHYKINSRGLRDNEHEYEKKNGIKRIVIIGDSRTFGYGVELEKHYTRILEGYCPDTEVINLGVPGYGVDQELLILVREGFKYQPDLVVAYVAHYGDHRHMHTTRFGQNKPKFELVDGDLVLTNHPVKRRTTEDRWLPESKVLQTLARAFGGEDQLMQNAQAAQDLVDSEDPAFIRRMHALGNAIVHEMKNVSSEHGAQFLLVSQVPELIDYSLENEINVLDVRAALDNDLFQLPDGLQHVNGPGNGVLAWEIRKFIESNNLNGC